MATLSKTNGCVCVWSFATKSTLTNENRANENKNATKMWWRRFFEFLNIFGSWRFIFRVIPKTTTRKRGVCQLEQYSTLYAWFHFVLYIFSGTKWKFYTIFLLFFSCIFHPAMYERVLESIDEIVRNSSLNSIWLHLREILLSMSVQKTLPYECKAVLQSTIK